MHFDRPDTSFVEQKPPVNFDIAELSEKIPNQAHVFQGTFLPEAKLQKGENQSEYLVFAGTHSFEDHSTSESQEERKARILKESPSLQLDVMVADRTREVIMTDLLGIDKEKSPLERLMAWLPIKEESEGKEIKAINDAWRALSDGERSKIESELRESARNPDLATPSFDEFINRDWSSALYRPARERRDNYLSIMSIENK